MSVTVIIVICYVLLMLGIGYWCMKRTKSVGDFFLGGRNLGPWMSAFAFGTTYFSSVLFIGYAGKLGWAFGIHTMWIVIGNTIIGTILSWLFLAGRTREMTARLNALTMPAFLRARFDSKGLQLIGALAIFIFLVPYSASVLMGLSYLFKVTLGWEYNPTLYFLTALTALYLVMGGYFAVAISDFVRGILEFAGVMLMVYLLTKMLGGFSNTTHGLLSDPKMAPALMAVATKHLGSGVTAIALPGIITLISLVLITSFGPWSLPQMVQKFYSIRKKADVRRAMIIAGVFSLFMSFGAYYSGALTHLAFTLDKKLGIIDKADVLVVPLARMKVGDYDQLMPHFVTHSGLPEWLVILIALMVFSASMSSLSSLVLVSSSAISIDIFSAFIKPDATQKQTMLLLRILCVLFVGASLFIALNKPTFIVNLMVISWGSLAGVFLAPYLYGLFWKRATKVGVYAGIFTGLICAFVLFKIWGNDGVPLAGAITMFLPMIVVPIVSLLTPPPSKAVIDTAFYDAKPAIEDVPKEEIKKEVVA